MLYNQEIVNNGYNMNKYTILHGAPAPETPAPEPKPTPAPTNV